MGKGLQVALFAAVMLLGVSVAAATGTFSASSTSPLNACANGGNGNLRLVSGASDCRANEAFVSWNVQGAAGLPGPKGDPGAAGPPGTPGPPGPDNVSYAGPAAHIVAPSGGSVTETLFTSPH